MADGWPLCERAHNAPRSLTRAEPLQPSSEATIELTFAIKQQNTAELESRLLEASDPSNTAFYGKWMSNQEVHELLAPTRQDLAEVYGHLKRHGVTDGQLSHPTPNSDFIVARVTIAVAQRLLSARFTRYRHSATGFAVDRCTDSGYSLPARVAAAVDFVAPTVRLPPRGGRETGVSSGAGSLFKPASPQALVNNPKTLKQLYSVGSATGTGRGRNKAAVTAFLEQYYQEASLQEFYNLFCQDGVPCGLDGKADAVVTRGDAGDHPGSGTESMLDIEYITALGANIATEFWAFAGRSPDNSNNEVQLSLPDCGDAIHILFCMFRCLPECLWQGFFGTSAIPPPSNVTATLISAVLEVAHVAVQYLGCVGSSALLNELRRRRGHG